MNLEGLGKRAVACKHWRFLPGMHLLEDEKVYRYRVVTHTGKPDGKEAWCVLFSGLGYPDLAWTDMTGTYPDLSDPATLGCLLALVREAWEPRRGKDYIASTVHVDSGWGVGARVGSECFATIVLPTFSSEAEALVAALEAAP